MTAVAQSAAFETVLAYHRAWTTGDVDAAMAYVADDFVCRAPDGDISGKEDYRSYLAGFSEMMTGLTDIAVFGDDEHVVLFYCPHTSVTSTSPAAEYFSFRHGLIAESRLVFDRLSFAPPQAQ